MYKNWLVTLDFFLLRQMCILFKYNYLGVAVAFSF